MDPTYSQVTPSPPEWFAYSGWQWSSFFSECWDVANTVTSRERLQGHQYIYCPEHAGVEGVSWLVNGFLRPVDHTGSSRDARVEKKNDRVRSKLAGKASNMCRACISEYLTCWGACVTSNIAWEESLERFHWVSYLATGLWIVAPGCWRCVINMLLSCLCFFGGVTLMCDGDVFISMKIHRTYLTDYRVIQLYFVSSESWDAHKHVTEMSLFLWWLTEARDWDVVIVLEMYNKHVTEKSLFPLSCNINTWLRCLNSPWNVT